MDIEKTTVVAAPLERVWAVLLDPKLMAGCVPGVQSVEVLSDKEYLAEIKVKISFISANFKVRTTILETRPPHYLRCEGSGEDSAVASSLKQTSELFLTEQPGGATEIRIKSKAEVFGRLGSFGLTVMKTKADRMWEQFAANLEAVLRQDGALTSARARSVSAAMPESPRAQPASAVAFSPEHRPAKSRWWKRLVGSPQSGTDAAMPDMRLPDDIYVELHRGDEVIKILWPASAHNDAAAWLKALSERQG